MDNITNLISIKSLPEYLDALQGLEDCIIIFCIKDTAGYWLDENIQSKMQKLGLTQNLIKAFMVGYIGIIKNGIIIHESKTENECEEYKAEIEGHNFSVISKPFKNGNFASVSIDDTEYAVNKRGLNIVVFNTATSKVIDSVAFDTHVKDFTCERISKHYDIGVVGCWWGANYGSCLNGYAVYKVLKSLNLSVLMINKHNAVKNDWEITDTHNARFIEKFYPKNEVSPIIPLEKLHELNDCCDMFLAGSDQIWNYYINKIFDLTFMLNFVADSKKKISFGTSFGKEKDITPKDKLPKTIELLKRFDAISVREKSGVDICKNVYGVKAETVVEPVFCLEKEEYCKLAEYSEINESEPYILTYILDPTPEKRRAIQYYSQISGLKAINVLDGDPRKYEKNKKLLNLPNTMGKIGAEDLMKLYSNCSLVITDSFHGTAFSIIFNQPFISITNFSRGAVRFSELLGKFGLMDRLVSDPKAIPEDPKYFKPIDFTNANKIIVEERERSIAWLKKAIETPSDKLPPIVIPQKTSNELTPLKRPADHERCKMLASLMRDYGIKHVVLSSGTRHVNLVRFFEANSCFQTYNVVDERSAGFFAIGLARKLNEPVAICCTSGTAASNYLSPVSEAYYQGIPLVVITADRYPCLLGQQEQQTVPQKNIFDGVIKKSVMLPITDDYLGKWETRRLICEALLEVKHRGNGPVHIDVPIREIIRKPPEADLLKLGNYKRIFRIPLFPDRSTWNNSLNQLKKSHRIMIFWGQSAPLNSDSIKALNDFAARFDCVFAVDHLSNLKCDKSVNIYNLMTKIKSDEKAYQELAPDILITVNGNNIVDIGMFVFKAKNVEHWNILPNGEIADPYRKLRKVFECTPMQFFRRLNFMAKNNKGDDSYYRKWISYKPQPKEIPTAFSQRYAVAKVITGIPSGSDLHLANSLTVRLANEFDLNENVTVYCNRGTNGIDGCASTFMGTSAVSDKLCFLLIGDLTFFYDLNSLWNKKLNGNLRIMLFNNDGASLLRHHGSSAITCKHNTSSEMWVKSLGFTYLSARNKSEFDENLKKFLSNEDEPMFFEVFTL